MARSRNFEITGSMPTGLLLLLSSALFFLCIATTCACFSWSGNTEFVIGFAFTGLASFNGVRPIIRQSKSAIKKDLRGKYMFCPRHMSYFEIMR